MITRRDILTVPAMAAAAITATQLPAWAAPVTPAAPLSLDQVRDLLAPAVMSYSAIHAPELEFDIFADYTTGNLLVIGWSFKRKRMMGFVVTKGALEDRRYVTTFKPCMESLASLLKRDDLTAEEEQILFGEGLPV